MIKFACHSSIFSEMSIADALGTVARLGFRYVDIATDHHLKLAEFTQRSKIVQVRDLLSLYNLHISDLYLTLPDIASQDRYQQQHAIDSFKGILPFVKAIEANGITLALEQSDTTLDHLSSVLQDLSKHAEQAEIPLSIEAKVDTVIDSIQQVQSVLNSVDKLQLTLDWAHMVYRGVSNTDIAALLPKTRHIHLRQAKPYSLQTRYADGDIIPEKMLSTLSDAGYSGLISMMILPYAERHHIADVNPIQEIVTLRDAIRNAREAN